MEVCMSLNSMARVPLSNSKPLEDLRLRSSLFSTRTTTSRKMYGLKERRLLVVEAKGKKGMAARQFQRSTPSPTLPKIEDDGNPKFVVFIRMANVYLWYPLNLITGGTTAKIMVAAKDNFLGKYIYKDTLARNIAAVIYRDEKEMQKLAKKQFRPLRTATEFRYGYKLVQGTNLRAALNTNDVIELPTKDKLKTVLDKVKDFFEDTKESFWKLTSLNTATESSDEELKENSAQKST